MKAAHILVHRYQLIDGLCFDGVDISDSHLKFICDLVLSHSVKVEQLDDFLLPFI